MGKNSPQSLGASASWRFSVPIFACCILLLALLAAPALAQAPEKRLKQVEDALEKGRAERDLLKNQAEALAAERAQIDKDLVGTARAIQEQEDTLSELEGQLADLKKAEAQTAQALDRRQAQMNGVLTALQRLAWRPSEALIAQPTSPADTVRSAILLRAALPRIEDEADTLRGELEMLSGLRADIVQSRKKIAGSAAKLEAEHRRLQTLARRKEQLQEKAEARSEDADKRLTKLATEAEDLRDLLARLEEERKRRAEREAAARAAAEKAAREAAAREASAREQAAREQAAREAAAARAAAAKAAERQAAAQNASPPPQGQMALPARGRVTAQFGSPAGAGALHKGMTIATRGTAQVVAPYDGQVAFAGPFRGYGLLLILEHGDGYHTLLAGMDRIDATVGQRVVTGEPVGLMGDGDARQSLYLELRRNGQPINPMPWLTARKDKVSG